MNPGPTLDRDRNVGTGFMPVRADHLTQFSSAVVSGAVMSTAQKIVRKFERSGVRRARQGRLAPIFMRRGDGGRS